MSALISNREEAIDLVSKNGFNLEKLSDNLKDNQLIVSLAIESQPRAIKFASKRLRSDKSIVMEALKRDIFVTNHLGDTLLSGEDIAVMVASECTWGCYFLDPEFLNAKKVVIAAVKSQPLALTIFTKEMRDDYDVVLEAVSRDGNAIAHASTRLKDNLNIAMAAVNNYPFALELVSKNLRNNEDLVFRAFNQENSVLAFADDELLSDPSFMNRCYQINPKVTNSYARGELRENKALYINYSSVKPAKP